MPAAVWKKRRRDRPFLLPYSSASAFMRASTFFCRSVCGTGMNSSLDTTCVGTGVALSISRAGVTLARSSSLNMPMGTLPKAERGLAETRHHLGPERLDGFHQDRVWNQGVVSVAEHPIDGLAFLLGLHGAQHGVDGSHIGIAHADDLLGRRELAGLGVLHATAEAERLEPGAAGELARIAPQGHRLRVAVTDYDVAQNADALAPGLAGDLGIDAVELLLIDRQH